MLLNGILTSIAAGDYESFLSHGTEDLAKNISEEKFREIMTTLRPVLLKGYYLKSTGSTTKTLDDIVFTWKLSRLGDHEEPNMLIRVDSSAPGVSSTISISNNNEIQKAEQDGGADAEPAV